MSEYWHNGSVVFDRLLTTEESEEICRIFTDKPVPDRDGFYIGEFKPYVHSEPVSCLDFDDYSTGRSGLENELKADMDALGVDELRAGPFRILWKLIHSTRFDAKRCRAENPQIYSLYAVSRSYKTFRVV